MATLHLCGILINTLRNKLTTKNNL
jgi:hypothetical protein